MNAPSATEDHLVPARPLRQLPGWVAVLLVLAACVLAAPARAQSPAGEYDLKAALLRRFAQFADWPPGHEDRPSIDICVVGPNPFGEVLEALVENETLQGRPFTVRTQVDPGSCHVAFISVPPPSRDVLLERLADQPVLTVGDREGFIEEGGIIELRVIGGRVRFAINTAAARRAGLTLSAQLLRLAVEIRGEQP